MNHVIPIARGGSGPANLRPIRKSCTSRKGPTGVPRVA